MSTIGEKIKTVGNRIDSLLEQDIDKRYRRDLVRLSKRYKKRRYELAQARIESYAATIYSLIKDRSFDIVLAPGNSGLYMIEILKMVYEYADTEVPECHVFPIYRDKSKSGKKRTEVVGRNILFVDDEIGTGASLRGCLELLSLGVSHCDVFVVAENHFFKWQHEIPGVSILFYPYANCVYGLTNNISFLLNDEDYKTIANVFPTRAEKKQVMALVMSGQVKEKDNDNKWYFDKTIEGKVAVRVRNYNTIKRQLIAEVSAIVKSGVEKHKKDKQ